MPILVFNLLTDGNIARAVAGVERPPHAGGRAADDEHAGPGTGEMPGEHQAETGRATRHDHPPLMPCHRASSWSRVYPDGAAARTRSS